MIGSGRPPLFALVLLLSAATCTAGRGGDVVRPRSSIAGVKATDYFPLSTGWMWTYSISHDGVKTRAVYSVLQHDGDVAVVQEGDERITYAVTPEGIAEMEGGRLGEYVIKNPIQVGTEWPVAGGRARIASVDARYASPAIGRYEGCVLIAVTRTDPARMTQTWFAPYLGRVLIGIQAQDGQESLPIAQAQLVAFNRPGASAASP